METAALVLGILSLVIPGAGFLFAILALVFGIVVIAKKPKKGFGIAATIMGGIAIPFQLGICAAVAIPAFINYAKRAKAKEAEAEVNHIVRYLSEKRQARGAFPPTLDWAPPSKCCDDMCGDPNRAAAFRSDLWSDVNVPVLGPIRYQYRWVTDGDVATVFAKGDLDCDGVESLFQKTVTWTGSGVSIGEMVTQSELE